MAGATVQILGIILRHEPSGEQFERLNLLTTDRGQINCLIRRPKRNPTQSLPDLFDSVEILLEQKNDDGFGFVKELQILKRRSGLGKSFIALEKACEFSAILASNLHHAADTRSIYTLFLKALDAWETRIQPEATFFKSLYLFAHQEGYPLKQDWFQKLDHPDRTEVASIINTPLTDQVLDSKTINTWIEKLEFYIGHHTDIRI